MSGRERPKSGGLCLNPSHWDLENRMEPHYSFPRLDDESLLTAVYLFLSQIEYKWTAQVLDMEMEKNGLKEIRRIRDRNAIEQAKTHSAGMRQIIDDVQKQLAKKRRDSNDSAGLDSDDGKNGTYAPLTVYDEEMENNREERMASSPVSQKNTSRIEEEAMTGTEEQDQMNPPIQAETIDYLVDDTADDRDELEQNRDDDIEDDKYDQPDGNHSNGDKETATESLDKSRKYDNGNDTDDDNNHRGAHRRQYREGEDKGRKKRDTQQGQAYANSREYGNNGAERKENNGDNYRSNDRNYSYNDRRKPHGSYRWGSNSNNGKDSYGQSRHHDHHGYHEQKSSRYPSHSSRNYDRRGNWDQNDRRYPASSRKNGYLPRDNYHSGSRSSQNHQNSNNDDNGGGYHRRDDFSRDSQNKNRSFESRDNYNHHNRRQDNGSRRDPDRYDNSMSSRSSYHNTRRMEGGKSDRTEWTQYHHGNTMPRKRSRSPRRFDDNASNRATSLVDRPHPSYSSSPSRHHQTSEDTRDRDPVTRGFNAREAEEEKANNDGDNDVHVQASIPQEKEHHAAAEVKPTETPAMVMVAAISHDASTTDFMQSQNDIILKHKELAKQTIAKSIENHQERDDVVISKDYDYDDGQPQAQKTSKYVRQQYREEQEDDDAANGNGNEYENGDGENRTAEPRATIESAVHDDDRGNEKDDNRLIATKSASQERAQDSSSIQNLNLSIKNSVAPVPKDGQAERTWDDKNGNQYGRSSSHRERYYHQRNGGEGYPRQTGYADKNRGQMRGRNSGGRGRRGGGRFHESNRPGQNRSDDYRYTKRTRRD